MSQMAKVRFNFQTELQGTLNYVHNIPRKLVTSTAQQQDPQYQQNFVAAIRPILLEHDAACRAASSPKCQCCGSPTVKVLQTPMSYLHMTNDPFIHVLTSPVCAKSKCEMQTRQQVQDMMLELTAELQGTEALAGRLKSSTEVLPCNVCGEMEETKRCGRCRVVAYCGREHQKADWKMHKMVCVSFAG